MARKAPRKTLAPKLEDSGESVAMMTPALLSDDAKRKAELADLALDLAARSSGLKRSLPEGTVTALAELVRVMNCYYSNLIEGHNTHPIARRRTAVPRTRPMNEAMQQPPDRPSASCPDQIGAANCERGT